LTHKKQALKTDKNIDKSGFIVTIDKQETLNNQFINNIKRLNFYFFVKNNLIKKDFISVTI
jgi:hypothetical protein